MRGFAVEHGFSTGPPSVGVSIPVAVLLVVLLAMLTANIVSIVSQLNDDQYDLAAQTFMTCETVGCVGDSARVT